MNPQKLVNLFATLWPNGIPPERYPVAAAIAAELPDGGGNEWVEVHPVRRAREPVSAKTARAREPVQVVSRERDKGTVLARVARALERGPASRETIAKHCGTTSKRVSEIVYLLRKRGMKIETERTEDGTVYRVAGGRT